MTTVDDYIRNSDGWPAEMTAVRRLLLDAGLDEAIKWRKPCFTHDGRNIAILQEMKDFLALMFFKGALLDDPDGLLEPQGANSRSAMRLTFGSVEEVARVAPAIEALVASAIAVEDAGLTVAPAPDTALVDELQRRLDGDPALRAAFDGLTPGRRREYDLHIGGAKKAATRESRIDACVPRILEGKGLRDR